MCIINENRMMYGSWDMKCDGHFLFSFWTAFCPFTSLTALKSNFEKSVTIFHLGGLKDCEPEISHILAELFKKCLQESCFSDCWRVSSVVPVLKNVGKGLYPISLLSVVSKVFEKLVDNRIVDHLEKCGFFLRSSMVLGLLDQLQIFWQLYLIELLELLTGLRLLKLQQLIYPRLSTGFGMLVFFTDLNLMEFQVRYLALFRLFSVKEGFKWFWMENLHKNIPLILDFLKAPFCVLHFS